MDTRTTIAIHEVGHALGAWWNGTTVTLLALGDGILDSDEQEETTLGVNRTEGHYLLHTTIEEGGNVALANPREPEDALGEKLMRYLLEGLAGPAAQWMVIHPEDVGDATFEAMLFDGGIGLGCEGDLENVAMALALLPEAQRAAALTLACWRAEALVVRYWSEVYAMADELLAHGRLEQHQVNGLMERHLGRPPWAGALELGDLDPPHTTLGDAGVVACWSRQAAWRWDLHLHVAGYRLAMPRSLIYMDGDQATEEGLLEGWYALNDHDHLTPEPLPDGGTLQAFAAEVMAARLVELRRIPAPTTSA